MLPGPPTADPPLTPLLLPTGAAPAFGPHAPLLLGGEEACDGVPHALTLVGGERPADPQLTLPLGTISTLGSSPRFSNRWLGKLIGLGTAGILPSTVMPRRAELPLLSLDNMVQAPLACSSKWNTDSSCADREVP